MEEVKQSLQQKQENYKAAYLQKRTICNRQSVYISGEIQKRIMQIVGVITGKQVSIGNFIDNVLEEHLNTHNDVLSALYREEMQKGIFNQPKEKKPMNIITIEEQTFKQVCGRFSGFASQVERICKENTRQPDEWLSGREVCALLGISIRSLQNYRDSGKLGYSQIGNKLYYKSADIERLIAECMENKITNYKSNNK